jgi:hypothetical protein
LIRRWFLLGDSLWPHTPQLAMSLLADIGRTPVRHLPWSPDLVPCNVGVFPVLKYDLQGQKFNSNIKDTSYHCNPMQCVRQLPAVHVVEKWMKHCKKNMVFEGNCFERNLCQSCSQTCVSRLVTPQVPVVCSDCVIFVTQVVLTPPPPPPPAELVTLQGLCSVKLFFLCFFKTCATQKILQIKS